MRGLAVCASLAAVLAAGTAQAQMDEEERGQIFGYSTLAEVMSDHFPTLRERLGRDRHDAFLRGAGGEVASSSIEARLDGLERNTRGSVETDPLNEHNWEHYRGELSLGYDTPVGSGNDLLVGVSAHVPLSVARVHGIAPGRANVIGLGFGLGVEAAYNLGNAAYVDFQGRVSYWDTDVDFEPRDISESLTGMSWGLSLETGKRFAVSDGMMITPRFHATYTDVSFGSFTDGDGVRVRMSDGDSLLIGPGLMLETVSSNGGLTFYLDLRTDWDVLGDSAVSIDGTDYSPGLEDVWGGIKVGVDTSLGESTALHIGAGVGSALDEHFARSLAYTLSFGLQFDL